jgi:hypothetical protein
MSTYLCQLLALAAGLGFAGACAPNTFDVTLAGQTTIHGDPTLAGTSLTRIPAIGSFASIDLAASEEFKQNQVAKDSVQSLKVTRLDLQVASPSSQGFDFLDEVEFYVPAGGGETKVAWKSGIAQMDLGPPNPVLPLVVNPAPELRDQLGAPSVSLTVRGSGRQPPQDTILKATVTMRVVLQVL